MKHSEFWVALEQVFGSVYGRSLAADLVLPTFGCTACQALERGISPFVVWQELLDQTDSPPESLWVHRQRGKRG